MSRSTGVFQKPAFTKRIANAVVTPASLPDVIRALLRHSARRERRRVLQTARGDIETIILNYLLAIPKCGRAMAG